MKKNKTCDILFLDKFCDILFNSQPSVLERKFHLSSVCSCLGSAAFSQGVISGRHFLWRSKN